jgi:hypothetical protein
MRIYEKDGAMWAEYDGWTVAAFGKPVYEFMGEKEPYGFFNWAKSPDGSIGAACDFASKLEELGFPVNSIGLRKYHQTLRDLMGKPACAPAETPEKRPIDPTDVDETWVGATVESLLNWGREYKARIITERPRVVSLTEWTRDVGNLVEANLKKISEFSERFREKTRAYYNKKAVNSTWPQRHPPGAVKERE